MNLHSYCNLRTSVRVLLKHENNCVILRSTAVVLDWRRNGLLMAVVFITAGGVRFEWQAFQLHSTVDASKQRKKSKINQQMLNVVVYVASLVIRQPVQQSHGSHGGRKSFINNLSRLQWCFRITNATFSLVSTFKACLFIISVVLNVPRDGTEIESAFGGCL